MPLLEAQALTVFRGDEPLFENVSLTVAAGEMLQIQGNNGSGKTTLLKILCGLTYADDGVLLWNGDELARQRTDFNANTLYLGHKPGIKHELTPIENLRVFSATSDGRSNTDIEHALEKMQLAQRLHLPCSVLSAGQRRRVALARLLLSKAILWVLDEPLTALDQSGRKFVQELLEAHAGAGGAIVYTTHQALPLTGDHHRTLTLA